MMTCCCIRVNPVVAMRNVRCISKTFSEEKEEDQLIMRMSPGCVLCTQKRQIRNLDYEEKLGTTENDVINMRDKQCHCEFAT